MKTKPIYRDDDEIEFIPRSQETSALGLAADAPVTAPLSQTHAAQSSETSALGLASDAPATAPLSQTHAAQSSETSALGLASDAPATAPASPVMTELKSDGLDDLMDEAIEDLDEEQLIEYLDSLSDEDRLAYLQMLYQQDAKRFESIFSAFTSGYSNGDRQQFLSDITKSNGIQDDHQSTEKPIDQSIHQNADQAQVNKVVTEEAREVFDQVAEQKETVVEQEKAVAEQKDVVADQVIDRVEQKADQNAQVDQDAVAHQRADKQVQQVQQAPAGGGFSMNFGGAKPKADKPRTIDKPQSSARLTDGITLREPKPETAAPIVATEVAPNTEIAPNTDPSASISPDSTPSANAKPADTNETAPSHDTWPTIERYRPQPRPQAPHKGEAFEPYFNEIQANNNEGWHDQKSSVPFRGQVLNPEKFALSQQEKLLAKGITRLNANPADMEIIKRARAAEHEQLLDRLEIKKRAMSSHEDAVKDAINHFKKSALSSVLPKLIDAQTPAERTKILGDLMSHIKASPDAESRFENEFKAIRESLTEYRKSTLDYSKELVESDNPDEAMSMIEQFQKFTQQAVKDSHMDEFQKDKSYGETMKEWTGKMSEIINRLIQSLTSSSSSTLRA